MNVYPLFRPLLFTADPEVAHGATLRMLDVAAASGLAGMLAPKARGASIQVMGLEFPNRVGLAAGLDKNAEHLDGLAALGFGFLEAGTVTPRPQPGNPKPRMFRLVQSEALINRLGFNNEGADHFVANATRARYRGILGINIGKNFDTPNERAADDYVTCLRAVYPHASYVTVNISSPNTRGLRDLQAEDALTALLQRLTAEREALSQRHARRVPLVLKIAPDLNADAIDGIARLLIRHGIDGAIATNTTISRDRVQGVHQADETGGLSGRPLFERSTEIVRLLARALDGALPIIGVGGIASAHDALAKVEAGATLVQLYTGLIYRGPALVSQCVDALARVP